MSKLNLTFLTGAGISVDAGLPLYSKGLTAEREDIATGMNLDDCPEDIFKYYEERRLHVQKSEPTDAHYLITLLQDFYHVKVITQNIDDLHEKAGTTDVIHVHGKIGQFRTINKCCKQHEGVITINSKDVCRHSSAWRHDIVLYGEPVKYTEEARRVMALTDVLVVVGCSMFTNTGRMLIKQVHEYCPVYFVNPTPHYIPKGSRLIQEPAYRGIWTAVSHVCNLHRGTLASVDAT